MQQIGEYTDNGNVVRVFPPAQAMGLDDEINDLARLCVPLPGQPFGWRSEMKKKKSGGGKRC